jgi:hypothetical protein
LAQRGRKKKRRRSRPRPAATAAPAENDFVERYRARSEARNEAARAALEPLEPGERPRAVAVAAVLATVSGLGNLAAALAGLEVAGQPQSIPGQAVTSVLLLVAAWGMWRMRYWAVLGMQALIALSLLSLGIYVFVAASPVEGLLVTTLGVIPLGTLFWFLVKAMARIQMPERP